MRGLPCLQRLPVSVKGGNWLSAPSDGDCRMVLVCGSLIMPFVLGLAAALLAPDDAALCVWVFVYTGVMEGELREM